MTATWPTSAQIRDQARNVASELTATLGAEGSPVPAKVEARLSWVRSVAGNISAYGPAADFLCVLGYLLAHRCTADDAGTQGSETAPIGAGSTAGAISGVTVGGMSLQYSGQTGLVAQIPGQNMLLAELSTTPYGRAAAGLMATRPKLRYPRNA